MKKALIFSLFSIAVLCSGCYKDIEVISLQGLSNVEISLQGMKSDMILEVYNPNFMDVELIGADVVLKFGDIETGDATISEKVKLAAGDTVLITLNVATRQGAMGKVLGGQIGSLFSGSNALTFSAEGTIVGKAWGMKVEIPVHHSEEISE